MKRKFGVWVLVGALAAGVKSWPAFAAPPADMPAWPLLIPAAQVIPNLHVVCPGIIRGGQPSTEGLRRLKAAGVRTVINLRNEEVPVIREGSVVGALRMRYLTIPLNVFDQPSEAAIDQFLAAVKNPENQPLFIHCQYGQDRTGTMVAIYRLNAQGWTAAEAFEEMVALGFKPGLANLTGAVYGYAARIGRPEKQPSADLIVQDLKKRIKSRLNNR